jgi:hypothetical protein
LTCGSNSKCDDAQAQQRPTIRYRRSGEPIVTTTAAAIITTLHELHLLPPRDPLSRPERARADPDEALRLILGRDAADLLTDLDEAIAELKRESGP